MNLNWDELNPIQRLGVATALKKELDKMVATRTDNNLRAAADDYAMRMLPDGGSTKVRIGITEVGTFTVVAKEVGGDPEVYVLDASMFGNWMREDDVAANAVIEWVLGDHRRVDAFLRFFVESTGVVPDGCEAYASEPRIELSTKFSRLSPQKVASALGNALPSTIAGLLRGDTDGR